MINLTLKRSLFNDVYFPLLLDYTRRYEVYYGGAGSGKSVFLAQKLIVKACKQKRKILVIRKVAATLKDSVFDLICTYLKKWQLYDRCNVNLTTYTITLPNGSVFLFKGLDDREKIKSITDITDIWCEEATELNEDDFTQLDLRLRALAPNLQMLVSFNPVSKVNWVYKKWFSEDAVINILTTMILKTTYKDNKFLPTEYIEALEEKARTNPTYYRIYALGEFCSLDKLVFNNWRIETFDNAAINGELMCGLDFGYVNDISAFVASLLVEDEKKIYIFKCWGDTNKTNNQLAEIIKALGFSKSVIIADCAEQKSIAEIKSNGIQKIKPCKKGKDSIIHGIQKLQQYEIIVHPDCGGIITEFQNYAWKKDKKTDEYINEPIDEFNHYIDALRYSLQAIATKLKTLDKNLF